jgi:hypothetical protein
MSTRIKHFVSTVYVIAIVIACVALVWTSAGYALTERTRSKTTSAAFVAITAFLIYVIVVLVSQIVRSRGYERALTRLGFVPLEWKDAPFADLLLTISRNRKQAFLSRIVQGEVSGTHVYLFNQSSDVAWWSKKRTTVVMEESRGSDAAITSALAEKGNAGIICRGHWCMIQARCEIKPIRLQQWLETVVDIATRA